MRARFMFSVFLLASFLFVTNSELSSHSAQAAHRTIAAKKVIEVDVPKPRFWSACAKFLTAPMPGNFKAFSEYGANKREYRAAVAEKEALIEHQEVVKSQVLQMVVGYANDSAFPHIQKWHPEFRAEIDHAKSIQDVDQIKTNFIEKARNEVKRVRHIETIQRKQSSLIELARKLNLREPGTEITSWAKSESEKITPELSIEAADEIINAFQKRALVEIASARKARHERELRFDIKESGNSEAIARAAEKVFKNQFNVDQSQLTLLMEQHPTAKRFIYQEMQIARSYQRTLERTQKSAPADHSKLARASTALEMRIATNIELIQEAVKSGNITGLQRALALRAGIHRANSPRVLKNAFGRGTGLSGRLDPLQREQMLKDALSSKELAAVIMSSSAKLPTLPTKPVPVPQLATLLPKKPDTTLPKPPKPPQRPSKFTSRSQVTAYKADVTYYRSQVESYNKRVSQIKTNIANYNTGVAQAREQYKTKVEQHNKAKAIYIRQFKDVKAKERKRAQSRSALLSYAAIRLKDAPVNGREKIVSRMKKRAKQAQKNSPEPVRQRIRDNIEIYQDLGPDMIDWHMAMYTNDPMWLIDRDIAMYNLIHDGLIDSTSLGGTDFIHGYDTHGWIESGRMDHELNTYFEQHSHEIDSLTHDFESSIENIDQTVTHDTHFETPEHIDASEHLETPHFDEGLEIQETSIEAELDPNLGETEMPELDISDVDVPSDIEMPEMPEMSEMPEIPNDIEIPEIADIEMPEVSDIEIPDSSFDMPDVSDAVDSFTDSVSDSVSDFFSSD